MTKKKNSTAGQRQVAIETQVQQLTYAAQIGQQMIQHLRRESEDIRKAFREMAVSSRDLGYKFLAYQELHNVDMKAINNRAQELQIRDYEEFSLKDDKEFNLTVAEEITENSVIIFTTSTEDDKGFLRSKQSYQELLPMFPQVADLLGKKVGASITITVDGAQHVLTVLGIRDQPIVESVPSEQLAVAAQA